MSSHTPLLNTQDLVTTQNETRDIGYSGYATPGRYGDPLNPWGDLMAVAEAWCVSSEGAKMAIGVPTTLQPEGILAFNAHRIYGKLNYPHLVTTS